MPVLMLLFLTLACLPETWPTPFEWFADPIVSIALTWVGVFLVVWFSHLIARWTRLTLGTGERSRENALRGYLRGRKYHTISLFGVYAAALYLFGYGWAVHELWSLDGRPRAGTELLLLAPFFAGLILSWACFHAAELAFWSGSSSEHDRTFFSRGAYVWFHLRQNLVLVFLPVFLLVLEKELHRIAPMLSESLEASLSAVGAILVLMVFITMPWIVRTVLGLKPLPHGPMRDRLIAAARRMRFRASDILLWNTRGGMANAMVVGVLPWPRYVLLTDRLIEDLSEDEVEAVFGHEVGHVKHHHMLFYLVFLMVSVSALAIVFKPWQDRLDVALKASEREDLSFIPGVAALGMYIFVVFGFLSRRCERQADIFGCRAVSCGDPGCLGHVSAVELSDRARGLCPTGIGIFIRALERVAVLNGVNRDKPGYLQSWQHSTIARRVAFLRTLIADPRVEPSFQRRVFLVKCGLLAALGAVLAAQLV